jgi:hypothetical protein
MRPVDFGPKPQCMIVYVCATPLAGTPSSTVGHSSTNHDAQDDRRQIGHPCRVITCQHHFYGGSESAAVVLVLDREGTFAEGDRAIAG